MSFRTSFKYLKSNMDRFIVREKFGLNSYDLRFKIQYG